MWPRVECCPQEAPPKGYSLKRSRSRGSALEGIHGQRRSDSVYPMQLIRTFRVSEVPPHAAIHHRLFRVCASMWLGCAAHKRFRCIFYAPSSERDGGDGRKDADGRDDGRVEPRDFANGVRLCDRGFPGVGTYWQKWVKCGREDKPAPLLPLVCGSENA